MQDWPFQSQGLSGRELAFLSFLALGLFAFCAVEEHLFPPHLLNLDKTQRLCGEPAILRRLRGYSLESMLPEKFRGYIDNHQSLQLFLSSMDHEPNLDRMLHAIADPNRRKILQALKERGGCSIGKDVGLCASDIEARIHVSQPTISHHMAILRKARMVEAKKVGQWMWYRRNEEVLRDFASHLRKTL